MKTGRIHDFIGTRNANGRIERDNTVAGMLGPSVYYSKHTNTIYAGTTAVEVARLELGGKVDPSSVVFNPLYKKVPSGFPANPYEAEQLYQFITRENSTRIEYKWEAHVIAMEFYRITKALNSEYWDNAMRYVAQTGPTLEPQVKIAQTQRYPNIPFDDSVFHRKKINGNWIISSGIPLPHENPFNLVAIAQHIAHHQRPGSSNEVFGIAMDRAFRVSLRSVFGYELGRALGPRDGKPRTVFAKQFVGIVLHSGMYQEYLVTRAITLQPMKLDNFEIMPFECPEEAACNISEDNVLAHLASNNIPVEWIEHAYLYAIGVLRAKFAANSMRLWIFLAWNATSIPR